MLTFPLPPGMWGASSGASDLGMGGPRTQMGTARGTRCDSGSLEHIKSAAIVRLEPNAL